MEKNEKRYAKLIHLIRPVLVGRYGEDETAKLLRNMEPIYDAFWRRHLRLAGRRTQ